MSNGEFNCAALICCPPESARPVEALMKMMQDDLGHADRRYAEWINKRFDLAKKGTLQPFKDWVATEARGNDYKSE